MKAAREIAPTPAHGRVRRRLAQEIHAHYGAATLEAAAFGLGVTGSAEALI